MVGYDYINKVRLYEKIASDVYFWALEQLTCGLPSINSHVDQLCLLCISHRFYLVISFNLFCFGITSIHTFSSYLHPLRQCLIYLVLFRNYTSITPPLQARSKWHQASMVIIRYRPLRQYSRRCWLGLWVQESTDVGLSLVEN